MQDALQSVETVHIQIISVIVSLLMIGFIVELIRRGKLREEYSFIWLAAALVFAYFSIWRGQFDALAHRVGIAYAPALLILCTLLFGSVMLIHFSIVISRLTTQNKRLAQRIGLLDLELRELRGRGPEDARS